MKNGNPTIVRNVNDQIVVEMRNNHVLVKGEGKIEQVTVYGPDAAAAAVAAGHAKGWIFMRSGISSERKVG